METKISFDGFKELESIFTRLPDEITKGAGNDGIRAGARIVLAEAKRLVPVKEGNLRDSLEVKKVRAKHPVYKVQASRSGGKKGHHAWLVELGTSPHKIENASVGGKFYKNIQHPGSKKSPFMRPALLNKKEAVVKETVEKIIKSVNKRLTKFLK